MIYLAVLDGCASYVTPGSAGQLKSGEEVSAERLLQFGWVLRELRIKPQARVIVMLNVPDYEQPKLIASAAKRVLAKLNVDDVRALDTWVSSMLPQIILTIDEPIAMQLIGMREVVSISPAEVFFYAN